MLEPVAGSARPDIAVIFDPDTYVHPVPYDAFARLRARDAVTWGEELPVGPRAPGPGYWAVWRHADVRWVLRNPGLFSSHAGAPPRSVTPPRPMTWHTCGSRCSTWTRPTTAACAGC